MLKALQQHLHEQGITTYITRNQLCIYKSNLQTDQHFPIAWLYLNNTTIFCDQENPNPTTSSNMTTTYQLENPNSLQELTKTIKQLIKALRNQ